AGRLTLVKADLGIKRVCPNCTARFYDLQKRPIECPKCEYSFEPESLYKQRRPRVAEPVAAQPAAEEEDDENESADKDDSDNEDEEEEVVVDEAPLIVPGDDDEEEEAEEAEEEDAGMAVVDADPEIEDIEVEDDEDDDAAGLLEEEEDEDDVSDII